MKEIVLKICGKNLMFCCCKNKGVSKGHSYRTGSPNTFKILHIVGSWPVTLIKRFYTSYSLRRSKNTQNLNSEQDII